MNRKNILAIILMLALGVGIFSWELRNTDLNLIIQSLRNINIGWIIVAFISMMLSFLFEALVLKVLLRGRLDRKLSMWEYLRIPLIQALFNAITPFSSGGQPAQLVALMQSKVESGKASSVLLMKFIVFQTMVMVNFIIALIIGFKHISSSFSGLSVLIVGGFVIHIVTITILLMIMYYYSFTKKAAVVIMKLVKRFAKKNGPKWEAVLLRKIDTFYEESLVLKKEYKKVIEAAILTFIQLLFYYLVVYFVLLSLQVNNVNIVKVLVLQIMIVMIVSIFPIPGGSGGAEYSFKSLFSGFLPVQSSLVLGMFLWRFITYFLGMFLGIIGVAKSPQKD
ncbi:phosphatidylglycerol lysyltransferase [Companilactobacillus sp. RD055328]|uniref:lysylphosphatidylglycerol synthase transmembrane domain-containing protein n=1 Tax=Companilactobacillus sp. RD055328 TaxID=2916634 RepID=UPI001FC7F96C|nr:lysylphosphatidylglycerol synthase transmembrane domain-containing protein [Companilactobacillus sp. RD055328]GKQ42456.1 phosphatidylglycerol lysyltransferase [Companilactobacillus sp. RD055328]